VHLTNNPLEGREEASIFLISYLLCILCSVENTYRTQHISNLKIQIARCAIALGTPLLNQSALVTVFDVLFCFNVPYHLEPTTRLHLTIFIVNVNIVVDNRPKPLTRSNSNANHNGLEDGPSLYYVVCLE
jgi:hypothetical protein